MQPGILLLQAGGVSIWVGVKAAPSVPSIEFRACVFDFTRRSILDGWDSHEELKRRARSEHDQIVQLAAELHARSGSKSTELNLGSSIWLTGVAQGEDLDPQRFRQRASSFVEVAVQVAGPIQWRFNGSGLFELPEGEDRPGIERGPGGRPRAQPYP